MTDLLDPLSSLERTKVLKNISENINEGSKKLHIWGYFPVPCLLSLSDLWGGFNSATDF